MDDTAVEVVVVVVFSEKAEDEEVVTSDDVGITVSQYRLAGFSGGYLATHGQR